ncbi:MAG: hypothetical protein HY778_00665 [Betaproteobacteria bacterium]|nr:hypothetical protein [Betaproteobacteria bacterium]
MGAAFPVQSHAGTEEADMDLVILREVPSRPAYRPGQGRAVGVDLSSDGGLIVGATKGVTELGEQQFSAVMARNVASTLTPVPHQPGASGTLADTAARSGVPGAVGSLSSALGATALGQGGGATRQATGATASALGNMPLVGRSGLLR